MSWIIVIEENELMAHQIEEAVSQIDSQIGFVHFLSSREFMAWIHLLMQKDPKALARIPSLPFRGMVTAVESWRFRDVKLIGKFRKLFVQMGFAVADDELCVVLTGYEVGHAQQKRFEQRSVNNFLHKPFDRILLKQMLEIALTGRHPVKKYHIHNQKTDVQIEMLKEIRLAEVTEIGFQTISDQSIDKMRMAKYYASFLETKQHKSALARALDVQPVPNSKQFRVQMGFFALDQQQSFNLQKMIQAHKITRPLDSISAELGPLGIHFVGHENANLVTNLQPSIERFFHIPIYQHRNLKEFSEWVQAAPSEVTEGSLRSIIFVDNQNFAGDEVESLKNFLKQTENFKPAVYVLSDQIFPEALETELSLTCEDIFYAPFNKSYIVKTLKRAWPKLVAKEELFESHAAIEHQIHVSNPVKVVEVSEAGLVMEYYRELSVGSFREFIFWMPNEIDIPYLLAQCNCSEYDPVKKVYSCHFVFFGLSELQQKFIRLWMLHNYIEAKAEATG